MKHYSYFVLFPFRVVQRRDVEISNAVEIKQRMFYNVRCFVFYYFFIIIGIIIYIIEIIIIIFFLYEEMHNIINSNL